MQAVSDVENWISMVLFWGLIAVRAWALIDCLLRKHAAFPAAGKLTKPAWAVLTAFSLVISYLIGHVGSIPNFISLILLVVSLVYLADVRPAVREVSGGSRW